jgi:ComF family protein
MQRNCLFWLQTPHFLKLLRDLFQLLFPPLCPGCNQLLVKGEGAVCMQCLLELGETRFHENPTDNELYYRLAGKVPLAGAAALFYFHKRGRFKNMTTAFKYGNRPQVAKYLGHYFGQRLQNAPLVTQADVLVPVPLHRSRFAKRGYNQSEMIAEGLGKALKITVDTGSLVRAVRTNTQTRKSQKERWDNVRDAFAMRKPLTGNVVLVDDVITTSSTLEACIRQLYAQPVPPKSVYVLALGIATHD